MKKAIYKVPNGKLLKIFLEDAHGKVVRVKVTGDFFAYPEENIERLEAALTGVELNKEALGKKIAQFLTETNTVLFGADAQSMADTILNAASQTA